MISKLQPHSRYLKALYHTMTISLLDRNLLKYYERTDTAFHEPAYLILFSYVIVLSAAHSTKDRKIMLCYGIL
jgi:hypothetical protein